MAEPDRPIPARLNLLLLSVGSLAAALMLYGAAHASQPLLVLACILAFSLIGNTLFSLMHEAVHGIFHPNSAVNETAGRLASAWFPTGLSVQRAFHLTHHRYNRSRFEQFDLLHDDDVKWLKYAQWYAILSGVYWLVAVLGAVAYAVSPQRLRTAVLARQPRSAAEQTGAAVHLAALTPSPVAQRPERKKVRNPCADMSQCRSVALVLSDALRFRRRA